MRHYNLIKEHSRVCSVGAHSVYDIGEFVGYFLTSGSSLKVKISVKASQFIHLNGCIFT